MGLIGSMGGSIVGGLLGGLLKGPKPEYAKADAGADYSENVDAANKRADKSVEQRTDEQMAGVEEAQKPFMNSEDAGPDSVNTALQRRQQRKAQISTNQLRRKTAIGAVDQKGQDYMNVSRIQQAKYQLDRQQADFMLKSARDSEVEMNQAIGDIVGGLASIGTQGAAAGAFGKGAQGLANKFMPSK